MKNNLLSLNQLPEKGYTMNMKQNYIEVDDHKQQLLVKAPLSKNKTFKIDLNATTIHFLSC